MSLQNIKKLKADKGFTIVELLIVIVIIGILAAITIVAYNGIQNRGKAASAQSAANTIVKKAEAANSIVSTYPSSTGTGTGGFGANNESSLTGSGIVLAAFTTAPSNPATVEYQVCTTPANGGARVAYWDYSSGTAGAKVTLNIGATCTAWGTALTGTF